MKREIIITADGSSSIYLKNMDEHYHSKHGAIAESQHIFIQSGLLQKKELNTIKVFEVGMGTGLNVLTTLKATEVYDLTLDYTAIEAFPIKLEEIKNLNFAEMLKLSDSTFQQIHLSEWNKQISLSDRLRLTKIQLKLQQYSLSKNNFDIIYFDAFAPEKQAEMWREEIFIQLHESLTIDGILITYCVKGEVRRRLKKVGFEVEKLAGPIGGKREICRAWKRG